MASRFRIFWRRGRQLLQLPELDRFPPPPPPGQPVSAWTPYFKRTDNATNRRTPEESPHNPAHPATPLPPFALSAIAPATSIKRRDIRRQRIPDPFHYDRPLTTRITHLTASTLYGQGPPTTRATHLTAMVLYATPKGHVFLPPQPRSRTAPTKLGFLHSRPSIRQLDIFPETPPGFFDGQYPSFVQTGFFTSQFNRLLLTPLEINEYPPTPLAGVVLAPPLLKANRTEFKRTLAQPLELNEHPLTVRATVKSAGNARKPFVTFTQRSRRLIQTTPLAWLAVPTPAVISVVAQTPVLKANVTRFDRRLQPLQLDEWAVTPPGFFEGQWPSHKPPPTFSTSFTRQIQRLPPLDEYEATPPGFFEGFFPAPFRVKRIPLTYHREAQRVLNPHVYPATPPGFRWPRPPPIAFKVTFERQLQTLPQLDVRPATPPGFFEGFFPAPIRLKRIPVTYHREAKQPLELNEYPATPPGFFNGQWPASLTLRPFETEFSRDLQSLPELDRYEVTPPGFFNGQWPSHKPFPTFKVSFDRSLQILGIPPVYPKTPVSADDYSAIHKSPAANRIEFNTELQTLGNPHEYPPTPPGFRWPRPPPPALRSSFTRRLQILAIPPEYPAIPPVFEPVSSRVPAVSIKRRDTKRTLQRPPFHYESPLTTRVTHLTASALFNQAPPTTRITQLTAQVLYANPGSQDLPETTPALKANRSAFKRTLQTLGNPHVFPPTPPPNLGVAAETPVLASNFTSFQRTLAQPLELNTRPKTPVSADDYSAIHKSPAANRIEFNTELQTLGNPHVYPATPPGFRWPRPPMPTHRVAFERSLQALEHNPAYPVTPPGFFDGQWPSHKPFPTFRVEFVRTRRELPELNEYPPTPPGFFEGFFPAPIRLKRIPSTYHREAQRALNPHVYPPTPPGFFDGQWPSHKPFPTFKVSFNRSLQLPLEINEYPPPPVSAEDYAGFTPVPKLSWSYHRTLQTLGNPHVYPPTPPGFFEGFYPGSGRVTALRAVSIRRLQFLPQLDQRPATPPPAPPQPAVVAFNVIGLIRSRQALSHNPAYPPTPPNFFARFWPAWKRVETYRDFHNPARKVSFKRKLQPTLIAHEFPATPPFPAVTSWTRAIESHGTSFDRVSLTWPVHNEYPKTPPSIIEGMAMWPAVPIHRRDIKRTLQPVWDPASNIPELFVDGVDGCWFANPEEILWNASATFLTWEADCAGTVWVADAPCK